MKGLETIGAEMITFPSALDMFRFFLMVDSFVRVQDEAQQISKLKVTKNSKLNSGLGFFILIYSLRGVL